MDAAAAAALARSFERRWDRCYVAAKLKSDPLYEAVNAELAGTSLPLLDLGCGLGLLALFLRQRDHRFAIHGLDYDPRKIAAARKIAGRLEDRGLRFDHHDARSGLPDHSGNVTILDILQFFQPHETRALLELAAARVAPGGKLIVRSALRDRSWRFKATVAGDLLAKVTFWMKAAPTNYPSASELQEILRPFGSIRISPLWGSTPFNNHLIVLERR